MRATFRVWRREKTLTYRWAVIALASTALLFAVSFDCKAEQAKPVEKIGEAKTVSTSENAAMKQLRAEVGDLLTNRVIVEAQRAFASVPEAQKHWPTREDMALAYLHSSKMLASLSRADGLDTSTTIKDRVRGAMVGEYFSRMMERRLKDLKVTDREIEDYYKTNIQQFRETGNFRIRKIFLNVFDYPGKEKEKRSLAEKAMAELKAGKPFKEVAEKYSDDKEEKGEVLRPLPLGEIDPQLEKAILALKPGRFTDIIPTKWGFSIFQLESVELPTTRTLESAREEIVQELRANKEPEVRLILRSELAHKFPVAKHYHVLDDPKTTDGAIAVQSKFLTITAGEFRQRLNSLPPAARAEMSLPESRDSLLDDWIMTAQVDLAASESGLASEPDIEAIRRYVTEAVLAWVCLDPLLAKKPAPTEEDIRKFYDDNIEVFTRPAEVRLRELVLETTFSENSSPRQVYEAMKATREMAEKLLAQARAGANFVELVKKHSRAPSAEKSGDTGFILPAQQAEAAAKVLSEAKVGEFVGPFQQGSQVIIYQLLDRIPPRVAPFDDQRKEYIGERLAAEWREREAARIRFGMAKAYRKDMTVAEMRKAVEGAK